MLPLAVFAWLAATAWLRPLSLPDEGRYVGVALEMLLSGNWLVPTLDTLPYFHKPPLFYWIPPPRMATLRHQRVGGPAGLAARRYRLRAGLYRFLAALGREASSAPRLARAGDDAALLRRRAIRQSGHACFGLHRRHDPVLRTRRAGVRRRSSAARRAGGCICARCFRSSCQRAYRCRPSGPWSSCVWSFLISAACCPSASHLAAGGLAVLPSCGFPGLP